MKIYAALAKFAKECPAIAKDSENPHFRSKYASLSAIQSAIKAPLEKAGIVLVHSVTVDSVTSTAFCVEDGTSVSSTFPFSVGKPQENGSAVTYAKRYNTAALFNLDTDADDDGNEATKNEAKPKAAHKPDLAKAEYTGTHVCTKCKKDVVGPDLFTGKYGECFKCPHCSQYSKPNPKKEPTAHANDRGVPTEQDISELPF
jgi:hypothetical protein